MNNLKQVSVMACRYKYEPGKVALVCAVPNRSALHATKVHSKDPPGKINEDRKIQKEEEKRGK
jgi:hypothetical protein